MAKDYAKRNLNTRHSKTKSWRLSFSLMAVVVIAAGSFYFYYQDKTVFTRITAIFKHTKTTEKNILNRETAAAPQEAPVKFDFYSELPNNQIMQPRAEPAQNPPPAVATSAPEPKIAPKVALKPIPAAKQTEIIVELGYFPNENDANELRVSLLLSGIDTEIVKLENGHYRVQKGPFDNDKLAKTFQQKVSQKGHSSQIKKLEL